VLFYLFIYFRIKEGVVGTTKLTRKEILSDDPVRENILRLIGLFQSNRTKIGIAAIAIIVIALGFWAASLYLDNRADAAGAMLGRGMEFFSASVSLDAEDDPYAVGDAPVFKSDENKYQAAEKEFSAAAGSFGSGESGKTARYYLGLTQIKLGKKEEAQKNLESAAFGSGSRTVGFLAKKALADYHADAGNVKGAEDLLRGMIKDAKCDLPKEDLGMQLARILVAEGRKDEAIGVLREVSEASPVFGTYNQQLLAEIEKLQKDVPVMDTPAGEVQP
jgi:predicted negative regulator of RcsB-dependent stress response